MSMRYAKQVSATPLTGGDALVFVIDNDGRLWERDASTLSGWRLHPPLPQETTQCLDSERVR